jgi:hypothetical protein
MWLLVLILSIKLQMPTWYWIIFTIITIFRPFVSLFWSIIEDEITKTANEIDTPDKVLKDTLESVNQK